MNIFPSFYKKEEKIFFTESNGTKNIRLKRKTFSLVIIWLAQMIFIK